LPKSVLIVEDIHDIASLIRRHVVDMGHQAEVIHDGQAGFDRAVATQFDLIVLDVMLPSMDGLEICRALRQQKNYTPILMLTARASEVDRVVGLELGADDYLTKPFSVPELQARIKAIFRRIDALNINNKRDTALLQIDTLTIDPERREIHIAGKRVELTLKEYELLLHFARHPGRIFTRAQLLDAVWGYAHESYEHNVNTHINRLRTKLEKNPANPDFILTVRGIGYRFTDAH
jgi:DNA-binding response OmpR family regulator